MCHSNDDTRNAGIGDTSKQASGTHKGLGSPPLSNSKSVLSYVDPTTCTHRALRPRGNAHGHWWAMSKEVSESQCAGDHRGQRVCAGAIQQQGNGIDEQFAATLTELCPANSKSNAALNFEQHDPGGIAADLQPEYTKTIEPGRVIELEMLYAELSDWSNLRPTEYVELCTTAERTCHPASFRIAVKPHEELALLTNEGAQALDSQLVQGSSRWIGSTCAGDVCDQWCEPKVSWNGVELRAREIDVCHDDCCECVDDCEGSWMLYTHLPRRHKQLLQTPSVKCLPYRASIGVSDKGVWHKWMDTWPALGRRRQTEVIEGVILFTLVANELNCQNVITLLNYC
eukprot:4745063-Amphidinium_carterae.10